MSVVKSGKAGLLPELPDQLAPVYLVFGDESLLVRRTVAHIAERGLEGGVEAFNRSEGVLGGSGSLADLLSQARTTPMMGPRRVVVVKELESAKTDELDLLRAYVASPVPSTVLIITGSKLPGPVKSPGSKKGIDRAARMRNTIRKIGEVFRFEAGKQDPIRFVSARVQEGGCQIGRREAQLLVEVVGRDLGRLARETDKLLAFMGGQGRVRAEQVESICSLLAETVIWDLTDAIVRREAGQALQIVHRLMQEGNAPARILPLVIWQVRQLVLLQYCLRQGGDPWKQGIRMPRNKMNAARANLRRNPLRLDRVMEVLARANHAMRGHRAGDKRLFEALVLELATR